MNAVLAQVWRGGTVESFHRGAVAIVDAEGVLHTSVGDIDHPVFPRSAVKALQALPLVASGAADRYGLGDEALALACASHNGEPAHVATAKDMLRRTGLGAGALQCGSHWPYHEPSAHALAARHEAPTALHNNCSGKHSGFVCLGCVMAAAAGKEPAEFVRGYFRPEHPVMRQVTAALEAATGADLSKAPVGTDGCSIPTYGISLRALARGFARFGTGNGLSPEHAAAARRLRHAVAAAPFMVGGTGRFDTRVMKHFGERVFCKVGAEGMYCAALPTRGLGIAIKIDDGQGARAVEVVMAAIIQALAARDDADAAALRDLVRVPLKNWNGFEVGSIEPAEPLLSGLRAS